MRAIAHAEAEYWKTIMTGQPLDSPKRAVACGASTYFSEWLVSPGMLDGMDHPVVDIEYLFKCMTATFRMSYDHATWRTPLSFAEMSQPTLKKRAREDGEEGEPEAKKTKT